MCYKIAVSLILACKQTAVPQPAKVVCNTKEARDVFIVRGATLKYRDGALIQKCL